MSRREGGLFRGLRPLGAETAPSAEGPSPDPVLQDLGELGVGYLAVNVVQRRGLYPLAGALVTVSSGQGEARQVWARGITDESGQTGPFPLPAPPRGWSQSPQAATVRVYGRYDVSVEAEGMNPCLRQNVPVFDGVTSIQSVNLTTVSSPPEPEADPGSQGHIYDL